MPTESMKAVRLHTSGGPEVLHFEDAPRPEITSGGVLVRVAAIGLNPPDWYLRDGMKALPPKWRPSPFFPITLGTDVSGVIAAVADDVDGSVMGDEVYSMVRFPEREWRAPGRMPSSSASPLRRWR